MYIDKLLYNIKVSLTGISSSLYETIIAQKTIRTTHTERYFEDKFEEKNSNNKKLSMEFGNKTKIFQTVIIVVSHSATVIALIGCTIIILRVGESSDNLITIYNYMLLLIATAKSLSDIILFYVSSKQTFYRLSENLKSMSNEQVIESNLDVRISSIDLRGISYKVGKKYLSVDSMHFEKGKIYVIDGASGSGKTLMVDLISGVRIAHMGKIILNDCVEVQNNNLLSYRKAIGYATQKPVLFHDTLKNNICMGRECYSDKYTEMMFKLIGITDIANRVGGMDTMILGTSNTLSGGERQRVNVARALFQCPDVIVLDDVFTSLDFERQNEILEFLLTIRNEHIIILVSSYQYIKEIADSIYHISEKKKLIDGGII